MTVDVTVETVIEREPRDVAAFAGDPSNAPRWYANIRSVEWETPPPVAVGSRMAFVAFFLGRRLAYTYEVSRWHPDRLLVMGTTEGPMAMETTYTWEPVGDGRTRMTLRNRGTPSGFARLTAPLMEQAMKRATTRDLDRLRRMLEEPNPLTADQVTAG